MNKKVIKLQVGILLLYEYRKRLIEFALQKNTR